MPQFRISIVLRNNNDPNKLEVPELGSVIITVPEETWETQRMDVVGDMYKVAGEYMDRLVACEITPLQ